MFSAIGVVLRVTEAGSIERVNSTAVPSSAVSTTVSGSRAARVSDCSPPAEIPATLIRSEALPEAETPPSSSEQEEKEKTTTDRKAVKTNDNDCVVISVYCLMMIKFFFKSLVVSYKRFLS
ncbi:MAG: hypothetical protein LBS46_02880 [Dysgonamonadaceae bacterium]|nr:hypothetical protein [Dysgonamonadaceae bacterium]